MNFEFTDEQKLFAESVRKFAQAHLAQDALKRAHNACTSGLCCLATIAGKYNAARTAALPDFDSRVRRCTLLPDRYSRGFSPTYATTARAFANRCTSPSSASSRVAVRTAIP